MSTISNVEAGSAEAAAALPSLGFFGGTWADFLELECAMKISSVEVRIVASSPEFLNLRGVLVEGVDRRAFQEATVRTAQSSVRVESQKGDVDPHHLSVLHTLRELSPYWRAEWLVPQEIRRIRVFNRADHLGKRARLMQVAVVTGDGEKHVLYDSSSAAYVSSNVATIERFGGNCLADVPVASLQEAKQWRKDAVRSVVGALRNGCRLPSRSEALSLATLLPTVRTGGGATNMSPDDFFLLAYLLCGQVHRNSASRSGVATYAAVLDTRPKLQQLEAAFCEVTKAMGAPPMYLAKHGISVRPLPEGFEELFQTTAERFIEDSLSLGISVSLGYGSLLGAIREGGPIPHDDDFDFFAPIEAENHVEFDSKRRRFMRDLEARGWEVIPNGRYFNFHVRRPGGEVELDVFGVHLEGEVAFAHMEKAVWRQIPSVWFSQTRLVTFAKGELPALVQAEEFLAERYGPTWPEPDQYHEWRWELRGSA